MMATLLSLAVCLSSFGQADTPVKTISGTVVDAATGQPLSGVIVEAYNDIRYSAMTDEQGRYELKAPLYVSSVAMRVDGFNTVRQAVVPLKDSADGVADGRLYSNAFSSDYERTTTAAVTAVASGFDNTPHVSIDPLIRQRLGGDVYSVARSGIVGMGSVLLSQGINSLNANAQPLVVIDGILMDMQYSREMLHDGYFNNLLANISVEDIESVTVLKNGTALYGAKGAGGVILIKTKRNRSMATKIDVTVNGTYELTPRLPKMLDAEGYRLYTTELLAGKTSSIGTMKYLNSDPGYYYYNQYHNSTDWTDEVYENAFRQNYGINVQGGDNVASYNLSVGYSLADNTLKNNDYSRFNMRLNTDISVIRNLDVRFDASFSDVDRNLRDDGAPASVLDGVITSPGFLALGKSPFLSPYAFDKYGNVSHYLAEADDYLEDLFQNRGRLANPVSILEAGEGKNRNSFGNRLIIFNVMPTYRFSPRLTLSEQFSLTLVNTNENYYLPIQGVPTFVVNGLDDDASLDNVVRSMTARQTAIQSDTRLSWQKSFKMSKLAVSGGVRYASSEYKSIFQSGYNTSNDKKPQMSTSLRFKDTGGADDKTRELTWYALADYNYGERYYLNGGLSAQTSSRFGPDADGLHLAEVTWGLFPSIEAAWVMTSEPWMAKAKGIDYLRLSLGFDVTGNDDIDYTASRSYFVANRMFNSTVVGKSIGNIGNTELSWETTRRVTASLEGNFIDNRLGLRLNLFHSWTSGLLALRQLAWTSGLSQSWSNDGKLENAGFDISTRVKLLNTRDFHWEAGASAGHYVNKVTSLPDNDASFETTAYNATILTAVGNPVGLFYGYKTAGVFTSQSEADAANLCVVGSHGETTAFAAGDMRFVDLDGDGIISDGTDINPVTGELCGDDRTVIGDPNPDIYGNIFTTVTWKRLKLDVRFNYSLGGDVYNYQRSQFEAGSRFMNQSKAMLRRWQAEGQETDIPQITFQDPMGNARFSDRWIEDGSYLRLKSATLSYELPLRSEYIQGLQFWIQGNNLLTFTKYLGSDPEFSMTSSVIGQGIDLGQLAQSRSVVAGVKINL